MECKLLARVTVVYKMVLPTFSLQMSSRNHTASYLPTAKLPALRDIRKLQFTTVENSVISVKTK